MSFGLYEFLGFVYTDPHTNEKYELIDIRPPSALSLRSGVVWRRIYYQGER